MQSKGNRHPPPTKQSNTIKVSGAQIGPVKIYAQNCLQAPAE